MISYRTGWLLLGLLVGVNLVNGTLLAILTPMWLGADEYTHYGYIKHLETHGSFPDQRSCHFTQELETFVRFLFGELGGERAVGQCPMEQNGVGEGITERELQRGCPFVTHGAQPRSWRSDPARPHRQPA